MSSQIVAQISTGNVDKATIPPFRVGDTVKVFTKISEGDKERVQLYQGIVISRKGRGATESFTVRRVSHGVGVEKVFPVYTPHIEKIEVLRSSHVRRAKLYFMRDLTGKKARLREAARAPQPQ